MKSRVTIRIRDHEFSDISALVVDWEASDGMSRGVSFPLNPRMDPRELPELFRDVADYLEARRKDGVL